MTRQNNQKLNYLFSRAPRGIVLTAAWLDSQGISAKLAWWYVQSQWLERIAHGAYKLTRDVIHWPGVLSALVQQCKLPIHVGGKTALQLLGKMHYIKQDLMSQPFELFASSGVKLPAWVHSSNLKMNMMLFASRLFVSSTDSMGLITREYDHIQIPLSSPERAALEICYLVPKVITFDEAALLIEHLALLRPKLVETLLQACQSIKAKRLFLCLSDHFQHDWLASIDLSAVELGKGKLVIAGGGQYHANYKLSTPKLNSV